MRIPNWISGLIGRFKDKSPQEQNPAPETVLFGTQVTAILKNLGDANPAFGQALCQARDGEGVVMAFERHITPAQRAMLVDRYASGMMPDEDRIAVEFRRMVDDMMADLSEGGAGDKVVAISATSSSFADADLCHPLTRGPDSLS